MWCARCLIGDCACDLDYEPQGFIRGEDLADTLLKMHRADLRLAITMVDGTAHCRDCVIRLHGIDQDTPGVLLLGVSSPDRPSVKTAETGQTGIPAVTCLTLCYLCCI